MATRLELPVLSCPIRVERFDPVARTAVIHRRVERGVEVVNVRLPVLLTVEKEIADVQRAPLPNIIRAVTWQPELWSASAPVAFDPAQIGIKGSPTIVGAAHTPSLKKAGARVSANPETIGEAVAAAVAAARAAGVLVEGPRPEAIHD